MNCFFISDSGGFQNTPYIITKKVSYSIKIHIVIHNFRNPLLIQQFVYPRWQKNSFK